MSGKNTIKDVIETIDWAKRVDISYRAIVSIIEQVVDDLKNKYDNERLYYNAVISQTQEEYKKLKNRLAIAYEEAVWRITTIDYDKLKNITIKRWNWNSSWLNIQTMTKVSL